MSCTIKFYVISSLRTYCFVGSWANKFASWTNSKQLQNFLPCFLVELCIGWSDLIFLTASVYLFQIPVLALKKYSSQIPKVMWALTGCNGLFQFSTILQKKALISIKKKKKNLTVPQCDQASQNGGRMLLFIIIQWLSYWTKSCFSRFGHACKPLPSFWVLLSHLSRHFGPWCLKGWFRVFRECNPAHGDRC